MKAQIITEEEIAERSISALPTRPNAPTEYGGRGFTAADMKAAFDALPLLVLERLNLLIEDVTSDDSDGLINKLSLGRGDGMTAGELVDLIFDGGILGVIPFAEDTLAGFLSKLRNDVDRCLAGTEVGE